MFEKSWSLTGVGVEDGLEAGVKSKALLGHNWLLNACAVALLSSVSAVDCEKCVLTTQISDFRFQLS